MHRAAKQGLLVVLVCSPFVLSGLFVTSLHDPEQGMYADIAAAMAAEGEWITPRFNGVAYFNKPPLFFWLTGLAMWVLGPWDWVARLWSALPVLVTALVIWRLGERLYGRNAGVLAAIVFASNIAILLYARVPSTDFLLVSWVTLALSAFVGMVLNPGKSEFVLLFYGSAGLAVLTKGLIGLLLPIMILSTFCVALFLWPRVPAEGRRRVVSAVRSLLFGRPAWMGWLLLVCLVLPWHVMAEIRNPGFFDYHVIDHQIGRYFGTRTFVEDDVSSGTASFLLVSLLLFFPWSLFLPASLATGFPKLDQKSSTPEHWLHLLVGIWAFSTLALFSLSQSKLEHYGLPAFPALSLMVGALWANNLKPRERFRGLEWNLVVVAVFLGLAGLALVLFVDRVGARGWFGGLAEIDVYYRILQDQGKAFPFESVSPFIEFASGVGFVLLAGFPLALCAFLAGVPRVSFSCVVVSAGLIFVLAYRLAPVFESQQSAKPVSQALNERLQPGDRIVHEGLLEYSAGLPFYTQRPILIMNGRRGILEFGSRYPEADPIFIDTKQLLAMWKGTGRVFLVTRFASDQSAIQHLPAEQLQALGQFGSKWLYSNRTTQTDP